MGRNKMGDFLDKLGLFDFLGLLVPGAYTLILSIYSITQIFPHSKLTAFLTDTVDFYKNNDLIIGLYLTMIIIAYIEGMLISQIRRLLEKILKIDYREQYFKHFIDSGSYMGIICSEVICNVAEIILQCSNNNCPFKNCFCKTRNPESKYFECHFVSPPVKNICLLAFQYCLTSVELSSSCKKSDKMGAISEMSGSLCITSFLFSLVLGGCLVLQLLEKVPIAYHMLIIFGFLLIAGIMFMKRYMEFKWYRASAIIKAYYIKYMQ